MLKSEKHKEILKMYCPPKMTDYEMSDTAYFLNRVYGVPYYKTAEQLGISTMTLRKILKSNEEQIKAKHLKRLEKLKQEQGE